MSAVRAETRPEGTLHRYGFNERVLHWFVALSFTLLMISGFALGYPRAYFLSGSSAAGRRCGSCTPGSASPSPWASS